MRNLLFNWLGKPLLIICFFLHSTLPAFADPYVVIADNETVVVNDDYVFNGIVTSFANTTIIVDTSSLSNGVIASGVSTPAISIEDSGSLLTLTIDSGTVSSENADRSSGTVSIVGDSGTSPTINIGQSSGSSGRLTNNGSGNAIYSESSSTSLTINNNATGTISSVGTAINLVDVGNLSSLTLTNAGTISANDYALDLDGYSADITNSGTISSGILMNSDSALSITNNAGEISGPIDLGTNINSIINLNGGIISGNVTMRDDGQLFVFSGGNLDGSSIDGYGDGGVGAGKVRVDVDIVLNGSIGQNNAVSLLQISDGVDFSLASGSNGINANKISIGAATLNLDYGDINTDEIDGLSAGVGIYNLRFVDLGEVVMTTPIGTTNGLEQFNLSKNVTADPTAYTLITLDTSIKVGTTKLENNGTYLRLGSGNTITGDVEIGAGAKLQLDNGSSVTGTIKGVTQYNGTLEIYNSRSDGAVSSVTLNGDVGGGTKDLAMMIADYATVVDARTNDVAINAQTIRLYSLSNLELGTGTVTGDIKGYVDSGSSNGFGKVTFYGNNTLGGDVGTSDGNALNTVEINSGVAVAAGSYEINALNINIGSSASLTSAGLISGGDNDDSGASYKDAIVYLADSASLTLNDGSEIYASINGPGGFEINTSLNSGNSHLNIGGSTVLSRVTLDNNASLDVTANNGSVKADDILFGDSSTLKLGDGEIVGRVNGNGNDDWGTLDIRGDVTLDGEVGSVNSLHLFNIGAADDGGYSVTAHNSIIATSVTINGASTSLSLDDDRSITSNVVIGDTAELSLGNGSTVNGTITGDSQNNGIVTIRSGATVAAGGNIGAGDLDLSEIKIHGTFDLSGLSAYEAHAHTFSLTNGASLKIGAGVIEGDIKGVSDEGGVTDGFGKGSVSFAANIDTTNLLVSAIGTSDGHAIAELSVGENLTVDTGNANISATRITLNSGASLTTSASEITGGDQIYGGFSRLSTQITLNEDATLALNNVGTFMGTIDGNDDGQGDLILTGSYLYDEGSDVIDIGGTHKLNQITLQDNASLDVSRWDGVVKANAISLGNGSLLSLGNGEIVGTIDGSLDGNGYLNLLGNVTLDGAVGGTHKLTEISIGAGDTSVTVSATSISANLITLTGDFTTLIVGENSVITGNITLNNLTRINLNDGAYIDGALYGNSQYQGELNIVAGATVVSHSDIGGDDLDLASVGINDGSTLNLSTNNNSLNAQSISLIDNAELIIGNETVTGNILGYDSDAEDDKAYGNGKGTVTFAGVTNSLGGNIGNDSGNAVNYFYVNGGGKSVDTNGYSIYSANVIVATNSSLTLSGGTLAGSADASDEHVLGRANLTLNSGSTFTIGFGATAFANIDGSANNRGNLVIASNAYVNNNLLVGQNFKLANVTIKNGATLDIAGNNVPLSATTISLEEDAVFSIGTATVNGIIDGTADNKGTVNVASESTYGAGITFGSTHGLLAVNFGDSTGDKTFNVTNSIKALTTTITGSGNVLNLSAGSNITGNVVLDGYSILSLGNGSTVNGTIRNLSDTEYTGTLRIRENATVATNGNIGGGGFNFGLVTLYAGSNLNLSTHNNSISAQIIEVSEGSTLTIGSATVTGEIQAHNSEGGSNYGLGKVIFAANNTVGGNVGSEGGATLERITINSGATVNAGSNGFNAVDIILQDNAILESAGQISGGADGEGAPLSNAAITLGDDAILKLSSGATLTATIDGDADNHGQLEILSGTITAGRNIGATHALESVTVASGANLNIATNNVSLEATSITLDDNATLTIGTSSVENDILSTGNGNGNVTFNGANNSLHANVGGHNDNALENVTINNSNSVAAGSHEINASTITLGTYATLTTSGAISGGADVTGTTPIATAVSLNANSALIFRSGSSLFGTIDGAHDDEGTVEFSSDFTTNGDIGSIHKLASVIVDDGVNLDLATNSNSLNATTLYLGDATLTIGGGSINAAISSLTADSGVVYINSDTTLDSGSTFGGDAGLLTLFIDQDAVGSVSVTSNDSIKAVNVYIDGNTSQLHMAENKSITGSVSLGENSYLFLNNGSTVSGTIRGHSNTDANGVLVIDNGGTVHSQNNIGDDGYALKNVSIQGTLDLYSNNTTNNSLTVGSGDFIDLVSGSSLIIGSGTVTGTIRSFSPVSLFSNDVGDVYFEEDITTAGDVGTSDGRALHSINIQNSAHVTVGSTYELNATLINLESNTILETNDAISGGVDEDSNPIATAISLDTDSTLKLGDGATVHGTIDGANDSEAMGNIEITGGTFVVNGDIGSTNRLAQLTVNSGATLDLVTNNNEVNVNNITLNNSASIMIATSGIYGDVRGAGDVTFTGDNSLHGMMGITSSNNSQLNSLVVGDAVTLTSDFEIAASTIEIGENSHLNSTAKISGGYNGTNTLASNIILGDNANLQLNGNSSVTANINAFISNTGMLDIFGNITGNINIGNTAKINALNIDSDSILDVSANNNSVNVTNIELSSTAELKIGTTTLNSTINGGRDDYGTLTIAADKTVTTNGNIGASNSLRAVNINSNATLNLAAHNNSLNATTTTLSSGATLNVGSGDIAGAFIGDGEISFNSNKTSGATAAMTLGTSSNHLGKVTIKNGVNFTHTNAIYINNIILQTNSNLSLQNSGFVDLYTINASADNVGTLTLTGGGTFTTNGNIGDTHALATLDVGTNTLLNAYSGSNAIKVRDINLSDGAVILFSDNSRVTGNINGENNGDGEIFTYGNVSLGTIGSTNSISSIGVEIGSITTFGGNISTSGNIDINGSAIFSSASTTITANSFNLNSGSSLSLSINLTSPASSALEVIGAAILDANTNLNLTITGSAAGGTVITLINASEASSLNAISEDKINLNGNGTNILNGQTYTTSVSGNQLLLTLTGDAVVQNLTFTNSNYQGIYDAIINVSDATGELETIQNYLTNNSYSIEQKTAAIKSALPQVDNSSSRIAFNNGAASAEIFSARLESLNNNSVTNVGPTFNFNMNNNSLEPLRDNNIKPSYPLSLAVNNHDKENKAMWIQTFGSNIKQDNTSKSEGYNSNSGGVLIGFDCEKCQNFIVGAAVGFSQSRINSQDKSKNTNIESYQISGYTGYNAKSYFFNNSATFALNNYTSNRAVNCESKLQWRKLYASK